MFCYSYYLTGTIFNIVNFIVFVSLLFLSILFNKNNIKNDLENLKDSIKNNFKIILKYSLIAIIGYILSNIVGGAIFDSTNLVLSEESVDNSNICQVIINLLIWAPITEELLFRSTLNKDIKNKIIFVLTSSLLFTGVHVFGNGINLTTLINSLQFIVLGLYFALLYKKTNNIIINIIMHFFCNVIGVVIILCLI